MKYSENNEKLSDDEKSVDAISTAMEDKTATSTWEIIKEQKSDKESLIINCHKVATEATISNISEGLSSRARPRRAATAHCKSYAEIDEILPTNTRKRPSSMEPTEAISNIFKSKNSDIENLTEVDNRPQKIGSRKKSGVLENSAFHDMKPLLKSEELPEFPNTGKCEWSFEPETRVVLAKFTNHAIDLVDREFLLQMMERTDIALVSEGLYKVESNKCWDLDYIRYRCGNYFSHRIRRFQLVERTFAEIEESRFGYTVKQSNVNDDKLQDKFFTSLELNDDISMTIGDYIDYVKSWNRVNTGEEKSSSKESNDYDLSKDRLYLIDFDVKKMLPESYESFRKEFMFPEILPGGEYCLMRSVSVYIVCNQYVVKYISYNFAI